MLAKLIIGSDQKTLTQYLADCLESQGLSQNSPDLLYINAGTKLGVEQIKQVSEFFNIKSYSNSGRGVVIENADSLSEIAQNKLLKTAEELADKSLLLIGATRDNHFLPTLRSRFQIEHLNQPAPVVVDASIEELLRLPAAERFVTIEKTKDRAALLESLTHYFHQHLKSNLAYKADLKLLIEARRWQESNVNSRAILEFLMLNLTTI